jgi:hypothetical protein
MHLRGAVCSEGIEATERSSEYRRRRPMCQDRNQVFVRTPPRPELEENVQGSQAGVRHNANKSVGLMDFAPQLFVGVRASWQSIAIDTGTSD